MDEYNRKTTLAKMDAAENPILDALANRIMDAHAAFDVRLGGRGQRFPVAEFDRLWRAVLEYSAAMTGLKWLHRDVARTLSGFREYLELGIFKTPPDVVRRADQMECVLFSDYDPYPDDDEPPVFENTMGETETEFDLHEDECAGCEQFRRANELGVCEDCSQKLERDLIRKRDWAYGATAYGVSEERREDMRRQIVDKFGEGLELIAPSQQVELNPKRRKRRRRK
jgi:hypothetical protein